MVSDVLEPKNNSNIDRLLKLQKRAARIILNVSEITTPSSILFQNLKWMPINDYFVYRKCFITYKVLNNLTPEYLNVFTIENENISIEIFI
jgi:hypothetical protein